MAVWEALAYPRFSLNVFRGPQLRVLSAASAMRCTLHRRLLKFVTPAKPSEFCVPEVSPALRTPVADKRRIKPKSGSDVPSRGLARARSDLSRL